MSEDLKKIGMIVADLRHWLLLALPFGIMYWIDAPTTTALAFSVLAVFAMLGMMLIGRKLVLPYFDAKEFIQLAREGNIAAAIVFCAVFGFMATTLIGIVWWVRG